MGSTFHTRKCQQIKIPWSTSPQSFVHCSSKKLMNSVDFAAQIYGLTRRRVFECLPMTVT